MEGGGGGGEQRNDRAWALTESDARVMQTSGKHQGKMAREEGGMKRQERERGGGGRTQRDRDREAWRGSLPPNHSSTSSQEGFWSRRHPQ